MITQVRVVSIAPGKLSPIMSWGKEVCEYCKSRAGIEVKMGLPIGGNPNRLFFISQYESLASLEKLWGKLLSDPQYLALLGRAAEYVIAGSVHDEIVQSL
jgi:hypothetical protein